MTNFEKLKKTFKEIGIEYSIHYYECKDIVDLEQDVKVIMIDGDYEFFFDKKGEFLGTQI
jgi:hypothetical protein